MSTTDHTREALIEDVSNAIILSAEPTPTRTTSLAVVAVDAVLASPALAAHVAAVVEGKDAEIERLRAICASWRREQGMVAEQRDQQVERTLAARRERDEARAALAAERERIATAIEAERDRPWTFAETMNTSICDAFEIAARIARSTTEEGDGTDGHSDAAGRSAGRTGGDEALISGTTDEELG